jgi:hypothetical protein
MLCLRSGFAFVVLVGGLDNWGSQTMWRKPHPRFTFAECTRNRVGVRSGASDTQSVHYCVLPHTSRLGIQTGSSS